MAANRSERHTLRRSRYRFRRWASIVTANRPGRLGPLSVRLRPLRAPTPAGSRAAGCQPPIRPRSTRPRRYFFAGSWLPSCFSDVWTTALYQPSISVGGASAATAPPSRAIVLRPRIIGRRSARRDAMLEAHRAGLTQGRIRPPEGHRERRRRRRRTLDGRHAPLAGRRGIIARRRHAGADGPERTRDSGRGARGLPYRRPQRRPVHGEPAERIHRRARPLFGDDGSQTAH